MAVTNGIVTGGKSVTVLGRGAGDRREDAREREYDGGDEMDIRYSHAMHCKGWHGRARTMIIDSGMYLAETRWRNNEGLRGDLIHEFIN
mmetsp:Transcript_50650/g.110119  ORF Transcript_50650/g.110119 Transcript_50650/m.110119 type:complete len:89 (+) Transcript_50650:504-770(+)